VFWASRAPDVIASAVPLPAIESVRCMSAASDLTWLAASADAVTRVFWASRAPDVIDLRGGGSGQRQRTLDVGGKRLDLIGRDARGCHQRVLGVTRTGG